MVGKNETNETKNIILKCLELFGYWSWRLQILSIGSTYGSLSAVEAVYFLQGSFNPWWYKFHKNLSVKKLFVFKTKAGTGNLSGQQKIFIPKKIETG